MLNVHVKLTGALADAARRSAGQLQEHLSGPDGERVGDVDLARGAHEPHVTLYMAEFREDQLAPLLDAVRATCAEVRAPEVRLGARVARGTYAFWECAPSDELVALSALLALRCARFVARERVDLWANASFAAVRSATRRGACPPAFQTSRRQRTS